MTSIMLPDLILKINYNISTIEKEHYCTYFCKSHAFIEYFTMALLQLKSTISNIKYYVINHTIKTNPLWNANLLDGYKLISNSQQSGLLEFSDILTING